MSSEIQVLSIHFEEVVHRARTMVCRMLQVLVIWTLACAEFCKEQTRYCGMPGQWAPDEGNVYCVVRVRIFIGLDIWGEV